MTAWERYVTQERWRATILVKGPPDSGGLEAPPVWGVGCVLHPPPLNCAFRFEALTIWGGQCCTLRWVWRMPSAPCAGRLPGGSDL